MDEMNKKPTGEDTLGNIVAAIKAETDAQKPAAQPTASVEVDEKFRSFFTTTVAVIPDDALVSGRVETEQEEEKPKKGLFGWLSGLFRSGRDEQPEPATGEVLIPGKTQPEPEQQPEQPTDTVETVLEPVDETLQIDLNMMRQMPEGVQPGDATGEIRLDALEEALAAEMPAEEKPAEDKPAKKGGGIRFLTGDAAEKPARKKEKKAAAQPEQPVEEQPAAQPAAEEQPARKLTFEDIDIAAILAAGAAAKAAREAADKAEQPAAPVVTGLPTAQDISVEEEPAAVLPTAEELAAVEESAAAEEAVPAVMPEAVPSAEQPTGEINLFAGEPETEVEEPMEISLLMGTEPAAVQVVQPVEPAAEEQPVADAVPAGQQPAQPEEIAPAEETTRELTDLSALFGTEKPAVTDEPTGEILLFPAEQPAEEAAEPPVDDAATREVAVPGPVVEHSSYEPQVVAVEQPTGEVSLFAEEPAEEPAEPALQPAEEPVQEQPAEAPAAQETDDERTAEIKEKTRTAAVHLFGDEEPAEEAPAEEEALPPLEEPEPAAAEYEDPADAETVAAGLHSGLTRHTLRMVVTGAIALVLLVLGLSAQGILLLATPLDPEIAPQAFLGVNLGLLLVAAGLSFHVMKEGLTGLVGKPSPHTLPAVTAVGALLQLVVCLLLPAQYDPAKTTVFAPLAVLLLFADHLGSRVMQQVVEANFAMVSTGTEHTAAYCLKDKTLAETLTAGMDEKEPVVLLSRPATLVKDFMAQSFSARRSDATARKLARILLGAAAVGAVLSLVRGGGIIGAFTAFAGVLCLGAPLSATLVAAVPSRLMQRAAFKAGAVVPGWYNVEQLSRVDAVQVDASELFIPRSAEVVGVKTFRKERIDFAIQYAASVLSRSCNTLSAHFLDMVDNKTDMLYEVKDLESKPGLGFVAWCNNGRVVVGNRAMMAQEDIPLPPMDYENRYTADGKHQALYLAVSGQLYALFVLRYHGVRRIQKKLQLLERDGVRLLVTCQDPTLTAERIEEAYKMKPGYIKVLTADEQAALEPAVRYMPASEGCMVHQGSFDSLMGGLRAASGANEGERSACQVQTVAVLFSVVLGLLLAFTGGVSGVSLLAMVLYQLAWSGLSVAITLTKKY